MRLGPILRALALVTIGAIAVATFGNAKEQPGGDRARGEALLRQSCSSCHAIGKTGESQNPAAPPFRTLGSRYPVENLEEALAEGIMVAHEGVVQMPEFTFSPEDVEDIIVYLRSVQQ